MITIFSTIFLIITIIIITIITVFLFWGDWLHQKKKKDFWEFLKVQIRLFLLENWENSPNIPNKKLEGKKKNNKALLPMDDLH
jgi:competence protein ComGC